MTSPIGAGGRDAREVAEPLARFLCGQNCGECSRPGRPLECGEWENYIDLAQQVLKFLSHGDPAPPDAIRSLSTTDMAALRAEKIDPGRPVPHHGSGPDNQ